MKIHSKTYVIADIHGAYKALVQCFERSKFDYGKDRLIVLGDVCDRCPETRQCIDELLKVKHCDLVIGNHDMWALDWVLRGDRPEVWISQGGDKTIASYNGGPMSQTHIDFLKSGKPWVERGDQVFVHGGFNPDTPLSSQDVQALAWDRSLFDLAWKMQTNGCKSQLGCFRDIFIGHTITELYGSLKPIHACNVWNIDTGAGWSGSLTIMDVDTKEYWQSDLTTDLYGKYCT